LNEAIGEGKAASSTTAGSASTSSATEFPDPGFSSAATYETETATDPEDDFERACSVPVTLSTFISSWWSCWAKGDYLLNYLFGARTSRALQPTQGMNDFQNWD